MPRIHLLTIVYFLAFGCGGTDVAQDETTNNETDSLADTEYNVDSDNSDSSKSETDNGHTKYQDTVWDDTVTTETDNIVLNTDSVTDTGNSIDNDESDSAMDSATSLEDLAVPGECAFLQEQEITAPCGGATNRCEQWKKEGNHRSIRCSLPEYYEVDSELVAYTDDAFAKRKACLMDWLENGLGATDLRQNTRVVGAAGTWNDIGVATLVANLKCRPVCIDDDCDHCYEIKNEADCTADAFCIASEETPVDVTNDCKEETPRFAICRPFEYGCDDAMGYFRNDDTSECWQFSGLCDDQGFTQDNTCRVTENSWCTQD